MSSVLFFNPTSRPLASLIAVALINSVTVVNSLKIKTVPAKDVPIAKYRRTDATEFVDSDIAICKNISELSSAASALFPTEHRQEIEKWLAMSTNELLVDNVGKRVFYYSQMNTHLTLRTFFVGNSLTLADIALFVAVHRFVEEKKLDSGKAPHLSRWYNYMLVQGPIQLTLAENGLFDGTDKKKDDNKTDKPTIQPQAQQVNELEAFQGMEQGKVVTRFPPEPSGYLHIGHVKAAMLNYYYATKFNGKMLLRFDDTNPSKEKEEYQEAIREDLELLGIVTSEWTYTSDYFPRLQEEMERLIKRGLAYVDDTDWEIMKEERGKCIDSKCRNLSVEENLRRWNEMLLGTEYGNRCCVRAKIDMKHKVGCMRDPAMYRCVLDTPHHRTGTQYKAYPLYDFACPLVDSWEGVTHAMRSSEYTDRAGLYEWVLKACDVRNVNMCVFSRLNFVNTVLSKRKLTWCIDTGKVEGWNDPRLPTLRGIIRRGLTKEGLMAFLVELGAVSKNLNLMEWDKLWSKNKQCIDPIAPRYNAVSQENAVKIIIEDATNQVQQRLVHPQNPSLGHCDMIIAKEILIEKEDADNCQINEEITLLSLGNIIITGKTDENTFTAKLHLEGDFKSTSKKLHWIPNVDSKVNVVLRELDHLITKKKPEDEDDIADIVNENSMFDTAATAEPNVGKLPVGTILQFNRRGYYRLDSLAEESKPIVLIKIPDGKMKSMSTISTKVDPAKLAKGGQI